MHTSFNTAYCQHCDGHSSPFRCTSCALKTAPPASAVTAQSTNKTINISLGTSPGYREKLRCNSCSVACLRAMHSAFAKNGGPHRASQEVELTCTRTG
eukprot:3385539-Amphidinium_carterae.2